MSYDKKTSLVQYGDWDEKSDSHPAMKWMHAYTNKVDEVCLDPERLLLSAVTMRHEVLQAFPGGDLPYESASTFSSPEDVHIPSSAFTPPTTTHTSPN